MTSMYDNYKETGRSRKAVLQVCINLEMEEERGGERRAGEGVLHMPLTGSG